MPGSEPPRRLIQAGLWWLAAAGAAAAIHAWLNAAMAGIPAFDRAGLSLAHSWRNAWLDAAFSGVTWLGSGMLVLPLALVLAAFLWRRGCRREVGFLAAALAGSALLAQMVKHLVLRPRPQLFPALAEVASPWSFPSAHAVQSTALVTALLLIGWRLVPAWRLRAVPAAALVVVLVDLSRVYLQVHYPSDVIAGSLIATFWAIGLRVLMLPADQEARGAASR